MESKQNLILARFYKDLALHWLLATLCKELPFGLASRRYDSFVQSLYNIVDYYGKKKKWLQLWHKTT
jgi:hypothetical protein